MNKFKNLLLKELNSFKWFKEKRLFILMNTCAAAMNTFSALSGYTVDTLQGYLRDSKTWVEFKTKCGLPKSRRQDGIRAYLDSRGLDYSHLAGKGQSGMQQKSVVWAIPQEQFRQYVADARSWTELLTLCGCEGFGNIGTVRRRIKNLELDYQHLQEKEPKIRKRDVRKQLLEEHEHKCVKCGNSEWQGHPIELRAKIVKDQPPVLMCPNCIRADKLDR